MDLPVRVEYENACKAAWAVYQKKKIPLISYKLGAI